MINSDNDFNGGRNDVENYRVCLSPYNVASWWDFNQDTRYANACWSPCTAWPGRNFGLMILISRWQINMQNMCFFSTKI